MDKEAGTSPSVRAYSPHLVIGIPEDIYPSIASIMIRRVTTGGEMPRNYLPVIDSYSEAAAGVSGS